VLPLLNVINPVGAEPIPDALAVTASNNPCADSCDARVVAVAIWEIVILTGVRSTLSAKLLSP
jgi:hypothetical protein